jgi:hypothetical protein
MLPAPSPCRCLVEFAELTPGGRLVACADNPPFQTPWPQAPLSVLCFLLACCCLTYNSRLVMQHKVRPSCSVQGTPMDTTGKPRSCKLNGILHVSLWSINNNKVSNNSCLIREYYYHMGYYNKLVMSSIQGVYKDPHKFCGLAPSISLHAIYRVFHKSLRKPRQ